MSGEWVDTAEKAAQDAERPPAAIRAIPRSVARASATSDEKTTFQVWGWTILFGGTAVLAGLAALLGGFG